MILQIRKLISAVLGFLTCLAAYPFYAHIQHNLVLNQAYNDGVNDGINQHNDIAKSLHLTNQLTFSDTHTYFHLPHKYIALHTN